jgi:hypothetical protein
VSSGIIIDRKLIAFSELFIYCYVAIDAPVDQTLIGNYLLSLILRFFILSETG